MEELISFLTENFYVVFIVIGIIYSLFFRQSPAEKPQNSRPAQARPAQGSPGGARPNSHSPTPLPVSLPAELGEVVAMERQRYELSSVSPETTAVAPPKAAKTPADRLRQTRSSQQKADDVTVAKSSSDGERVLRNKDLAHSVVWAEILGSPRAHRPYRR